MLLTNFYTLCQLEAQSDNTWKAQIELNPNHALYQGHFPGHPVVPGVCLLQIIKECTENIRNERLQYVQMASCKFLAAVVPSEMSCLQLTLKLNEMEDGLLKLQAEGTANESGFIKLKAVLQTNV